MLIHADGEDWVAVGGCLQVVWTINLALIIYVPSELVILLLVIPAILTLLEQLGADVLATQFFLYH